MHVILPPNYLRMRRGWTGFLLLKGGGAFSATLLFMFLFLMLSFPHGCTFPCIHPSVSVQLHKGFFFFWLLVWRSLLPPLASFWLLNKHTCTHTVIWYESGYKGQSPRCYCKLAYLKKSSRICAVSKQGLRSDRSESLDSMSQGPLG